MQVDFLKTPPPLEFGKGDDAFKLFIRPVKESDRMDVIDGIQNNSLRMVSEAACGIVIGWDNVCNSEGVPVKFHYTDENDRNVSRMGDFLGAIPLALHMSVLGGLLGFMGFGSKFCQQVVGDLAGSDFDARPTSPPDANTTNNASGG